ncbi:MAG: ATP-binding cassette domain-containing protein [Thermaerobacter sp.]|nr:ATP-binding cassette domain-containing protein [Thermaerobacter sp.]
MVIQMEAITFSYGKQPVLEQATLEIPPGEIVGLLGLNGSGKTTTMRLIAGILTPSRGNIVRRWRRLGYLPEERGLYRKMLVRDYLAFLARLDGMTGAAARSAVGRQIERFGLEQYRGARIDSLSKGNQQKVQLAATVLSPVELLLWDEPFSGLDAMNQELLRRVVDELRAEGTAVLLSTHQIDDLEELAQRTYILADRRYHRYQPPLTPSAYIIETHQNPGWAVTTIVVAADDFADAVARLQQQAVVIRSVRPENDLKRIFRQLHDGQGEIGNGYR